MNTIITVIIIVIIQTFLIATPIIYIRRRKKDPIRKLTKENELLRMQLENKELKDRLGKE